MNLRTRRVTIIISMMIMTALLSGCAGLQGTGGQGTEIQLENGMRTAEVKTGDIVTVISASGQYVPVKLTSLFFNNLSGPLSKLYVRADDQIKAGDPVAEIDPENITKEVEKQKMTMQLWTIRKMQSDEGLASSARNLKLAKLDLDKATKNNTDNPTEDSAQELEKQQILYDQAVSSDKNTRWNRSIIDIQAKLDEQALAELNAKLADTVLKSPVNGIVMFVENLSETEMVNSGKVIARIAEPQNIVLQMLATDVGYIQNVKNGTLTIGTEKYDIELYTPQAGDLLKQDASADKRIYVKFGEKMPIINLESMVNVSLELAKSNVLVVPKAAIRDLNGKTVVDIYKGNLLETVEVVRGLEQDGNVEIVSGLEVGQIVALQY